MIVPIEAASIHMTAIFGVGRRDDFHPPRPNVQEGRIRRMHTLHSPLKLGALTVPNRIFMAPLTRCRAVGGDHVPSALMAEYYAQRASAGLIIAEATMAVERNSAFWTEPGIYSQAQVAAWKLTTDAVHATGGRIFLQIWHGGRACHPLLNGGAQPVAPSPIAIAGDEVNTPEGKKPYVMPRELRDDELPGIVAARMHFASTNAPDSTSSAQAHGKSAVAISRHGAGMAGSDRRYR
jgi:N-ethylmaleimide reductase